MAAMSTLWPLFMPTSCRNWIAVFLARAASLLVFPDVMFDVSISMISKPSVGGPGCLASSSLSFLMAHHGVCVFLPWPHNCPEFDTGRITAGFLVELTNRSNFQMQFFQTGVSVPSSGCARWVLVLDGLVRQDFRRPTIAWTRAKRSRIPLRPVRISIAKGSFD